MLTDKLELAWGHWRPYAFDYGTSNPGVSAPEVSSRAIKLWCKHNGTRPPGDLSQHLAKIKQRGFDERKSYEVEGVINISFPVLDDRGYGVAALSVPFLQRIEDSITTSTVKHLLGKASCELSEAIGGVANPKESLS